MSLSLPLQCCAFRQAFRSPQKICIGISKSHELIRISRSARLSVGSVVRATRNEKRRLKHCPQPEINPSALLQGSHTSSLTANLPRGTTGVQTRTPQRWPETQTQLGSPSLRCFSTKRTKKPSDQNPSAPSQTELNKIFGQKVDREKAVQLLLKLQEQRRRGTLDQGLDFPPEWVDRGLTYLRAKYPLDEDAAILARLDREIDGDWSSPQTNPERSRSGQSGLQEIRRINREKQLAEKAAQEAKEKEKEQLLVKAHQEKQNDQSLRALVTKKRNDAVIDDGYIRRPGLPAMPAWVAKYYDEASERHIPQMSKAQRLIPCALFTVGAVGIALLIAQVYEPPAPSARIFPNMSPAAAAVGAIVAANCVVFLLWRVPRLWKFMNMHFMMVPAIPRPFQLLGSEFSHQEFSHLLANMVGIWFVGTHLHDDIGRGRFIALVICGCIIPSFCSLTAYVMNSIFITATVGASGLLCTMLGVSCILHEGQKITLPFLPPEYTAMLNPAVVLATLIALETIAFLRLGLSPTRLINNPNKSNIDRIGHLAGLFAGIAGGVAIRHTDPYWGNLPRRSFWRDYEEKKGEGEQKQEASEAVLVTPRLRGTTTTTTTSPTVTTVGGGRARERESRR